MRILVLILCTILLSPRPAEAVQCQGWQTQCGDLCSDLWVNCKCGQEVLKNSDKPKTEYCCVPPNPQQGNLTPSQQCHYDTEGDEFSNVTCPAVSSSVLPTTQQCDGKCYNDYETSQFLGDYAHYTCTDDTCLPIVDMCQGYSCSRTNVSECGRELRCIDKGNAGITKLDSEIAEDHYYCYYSGYKNDGVYHRLDRSDEDIFNRTETTGFTGELPLCDNGRSVKCGASCNEMPLENYRC